MKEVEEWRNIPDFEGYYQVSNLGNVKSLDRTLVNKLGVSFFRRGIPIRPDLNKRGKGYYQVNLSNGTKKRKWFKVHRLVCLAFLEVPENFKELQVNHINGITTDNRLCNLVWCTAKDNVKHAYETGLTPLGSNRPSSKLNEDDIKEIRSLYAVGNYTTQKLADKYKVTRHMIGLIVNKKRWKHVK